MAAGGLVCLYAPEQTLCTTRPAAAALGPLLLAQLHEHMPMYIGMALGSLVSLVAAWNQGTPAWRLAESLRGVRCFALMSIGMMLGALVVAGAPEPWRDTAMLPPMAIAMLIGMLIALSAEHLCEHVVPHHVLARPRSGGLSR